MDYGNGGGSQMDGEGEEGSAAAVAEHACSYCGIQARPATVSPSQVKRQLSQLCVSQDQTS